MSLFSSRYYMKFIFEEKFQYKKKLMIGLGLNSVCLILSEWTWQVIWTPLHVKWWFILATVMNVSTEVESVCAVPHTHTDEGHNTLLFPAPPFNRLQKVDDWPKPNILCQISILFRQASSSISIASNSGYSKKKSTYVVDLTTLICKYFNYLAIMISELHFYSTS